MIILGLLTINTGKDKVTNIVLDSRASKVVTHSSQSFGNTHMSASWSGVKFFEENLDEAEVLWKPDSSFL